MEKLFHLLRKLTILALSEVDVFTLIVAEPIHLQLVVEIAKLAVSQPSRFCMALQLPIA